MDISIIIPSYKSEIYILNCLESIYRQRTNASYEVILVDSSPKNLPPFVKNVYPEVKAIYLQKQTFPGEARNIGAKESKGGILAFIDSDCIANEDWIDKMFYHHQNSTKTVVGSIVNGRPFDVLSQAEFFLQFREFSVYSKEREIKNLMAANFSTRKELFFQIGGFSSYRASEDTLFALAISGAGEKIHFSPEIKVSHMKKLTLGSFARNQILLGNAAAIVRKKQPKIHGAFFAKLFFAPLLPFVRTLRTIGFIYQYSLKGFLKSLLILLVIFPLFFFGASVWAKGFAQGIRSR